MYIRIDLLDDIQMFHDWSISLTIGIMDLTFVRTFQIINFLSSQAQQIVPCNLLQLLLALNFSRLPYLIY